MANLILTFNAASGQWATAVQDTPGHFQKSDRIGSVAGTVNPNEGYARFACGFNPLLFPYIDNVSEIIVRINVASYGFISAIQCGYYQWAGDPRSETAADLYAKCASGDTWYNSDNIILRMNTLEAIAGEDAIADLNSSGKGQGWWGLSFYCVETTPQNAVIDRVELEFVDVPAPLRQNLKSMTLSRRRRRGRS